MACVCVFVCGTQVRQAGARHALEIQSDGNLLPLGVREVNGVAHVNVSGELMQNFRSDSKLKRSGDSMPLCCTKRFCASSIWASLAVKCKVKLCIMRCKWKKFSARTDSIRRFRNAINSARSCSRSTPSTLFKSAVVVVSVSF